MSHEAPSSPKIRRAYLSIESLAIWSAVLSGSFCGPEVDDVVCEEGRGIGADYLDNKRGRRWNAISRYTSFSM